MKKDIPNLKVENIAISICPRDIDSELWDVYILNLKESPIKNIIVTAYGYGDIEGKQKHTTKLRYFIEKLDANTATLLEPIQTKTFVLTNEYWVSFQWNDNLYDKKYIFVKGSISKDYFSSIPILEKQGVLIK